MSIEGGMYRAVDRAEQVDATALQIFVKSARQWTAKELDADSARQFRDRLRDRGLERHTLAHASYLINLATADDALHERSVAALREELRRCAILGIPYLVLHPGAHGGQGEQEGLRRVVEGLDRAMDERSTDNDPSSVTVLLETTAGQGSGLGDRFEHLGWLLGRAARGERLGVCFDTCHVLAAGYEFRDRASYRQTFREFDRTIGLDRLMAFHLNDSKRPLGSRRDRHEQIGRGEVGLEAFRLLINDRRFRDLPMVLETPKGRDLREDRENLAILREMLPGSRR